MLVWSNKELRKSQLETRKQTTFDSKIFFHFRKKNNQKITFLIFTKPN